MHATIHCIRRNSTRFDGLAGKISITNWSLTCFPFFCGGNSNHPPPLRCWISITSGIFAKYRPIPSSLVSWLYMKPATLTCVPWEFRAVWDLKNSCRHWARQACNKPYLTMETDTIWCLKRFVEIR